MLMRLARIIPVMASVMFLTGCSLAQQLNLGPPGFTERAEAADTAFQRGRYNQAAELYSQLATENRSLVMPTHRLGIIAYHANDLPEAQRQFQRTLNRDPNHAPSQYNLAIVHLESARQLLRQHERLAPQQAAQPSLLSIRRALEAIVTEDSTSGTGQ